MNRTAAKQGGATSNILLTLLGLAIGIVVFTPWSRMCEKLLVAVDERLPAAHLYWDTVDRAGPSGFRVVNLAIGVKGMPGKLYFKHADVRLGFSPFVRVRFDTGGAESYLRLHKDGKVEFEGNLDLLYLFGGGDIAGIVHTNADLIFDPGATRPRSGQVDIAAEELILPGSRKLQGLQLRFSTDDGSQARIGKFSLESPIAVKAQGNATLNKTNMLLSMFELQGIRTVDGRTQPWTLSNRLGDILSLP